MGIHYFINLLRNNIWTVLTTDMCGPQEKCCCFPAVTGVKILAILLTLAELGGLIYTGVNYSDLKLDYGTEYVAGELAGSVILLLSNVLLLAGVFKQIRSLFLPWLIVYMLAIIGLVVATVVIGIAFVIRDFTGVGLVLCGAGDRRWICDLLLDCC